MTIDLARALRPANEIGLHRPMSSPTLELRMKARMARAPEATMKPGFYVRPQCPFVDLGPWKQSGPAVAGSRPPALQGPWTFSGRFRPCVGHREVDDARVRDPRPGA